MRVALTKRIQEYVKTLIVHLQRLVILPLRLVHAAHVVVRDRHVWVVLAVSALDFGWAHRAALRAALAVSLVLCGVGVALLAMAWRHETFPSRPRCIAADEEPLASPLTRTRSSERAGVGLV